MDRLLDGRAVADSDFCLLDQFGISLRRQALGGIGDDAAARTFVDERQYGNQRRVGFQQFANAAEQLLFVVNGVAADGFKKIFQIFHNDSL